MTRRCARCDGITEQNRLLRRVLAEYIAGNRIVDGHWYSPDENGDPHFDNGPAGVDELALIDGLRQEYGIDA